jgi:FlaA1/EpsC-like NDP-sugar epimerase
MSCIFGDNRDIFFPKLSEELDLISFGDIAVRYIRALGYEPYMCNNEKEARKLSLTLPKEGKWPCLFVGSDTTGEKNFEEFFTSNEVLDLKRFQKLGIVKNTLNVNLEKLNHFEKVMTNLKNQKSWTKEPILDLFHDMIPDFGHKETGKYLDSKM